MNANELLNVAQAAQRLRITPFWVYQLKKQRKLPFYKMGKRIYFKSEDIDNYINSCRVEALDSPC